MVAPALYPLFIFGRYRLKCYLELIFRILNHILNTNFKSNFEGDSPTIQKHTIRCSEVRLERQHRFVAVP